MYINQKIQTVLQVWISSRSIWQEFQYLFQTFEDLESVKDKTADIQAIREVLTENAVNQIDGGRL